MPIFSTNSWNLRKEVIGDRDFQYQFFTQAILSWLWFGNCLRYVYIWVIILRSWEESEKNLLPFLLSILHICFVKKQIFTTQMHVPSCHKRGFFVLETIIFPFIQGNKSCSVLRKPSKSLNTGTEDVFCPRYNGIKQHPFFENGCTYKWLVVIAPSICETNLKHTMEEGGEGWRGGYYYLKRKQLIKGYFL